MESNRNRSQTCRFFNRPGGCRFGTACKFSHVQDTDAHQQGSQLDSTRPIGHHRRDGNRNTQQSRGDTFTQWRYGIPLQPLHAQKLGPRLSTWLQTAHDLVETEVSVAQEVIFALVSEGGLLRLKELLERDFEAFTNLVGHQVFSDQLLPFFKVLTNQTVAASIILEEKVGTIYNFLYGRQGERGINVFTFVVRVLATRDRSDTDSDPTLETILAVFSSMIDINGHALTNEQLRPLADCLFDLCQGIDKTISSRLRKLVIKIKRRLGVGEILQNTESQPKPLLPKATFVLPQDLPGSLSQGGPRHDNDHSNIRDIQVLPTFSEIKAVRPPYLPSRDSSQLHLPGINGLLDRLFRLLREDTVGQLRDAIGAELEQNQVLKQRTTRVFTYDNLVIMSLAFSRWKGLRFLVRVDQPQHLRKATVEERKEWWKFSNRLKLDALVCIIGQQNSIMFCTVSEISHTVGTKPGVTERDEGSNRNTHSSADHCFFQLQLVNSDAPEILKVLQHIDDSGQNLRLVEFPGILLPSFAPTLEALKTMSESSELPFADLLAPEEESDKIIDSLSLPLYASRPGFDFDLSSVMKDKSPMQYIVGEAFDMHKFKAGSQLDDAQADALVSCLGRSLSLIQGPPGTGKSFTGVALIKVLLAVKKKAKFGPIICVCYTNHALDQLLEHLVHNDVERIIRIGSRSKSEVLEMCNLRAVAQKMTLTGVEKKMRWEAFQDLESEEQEIEELLETLALPNSRQSLKSYLETRHVKHHDQLFVHDSHQAEADGFQTVDHGRGHEIQKWLKGGTRHPNDSQVRRVIILERVRLQDMNHNERRALYSHWLEDIKQGVSEKLVTAVQSHRSKKTNFDRIRNETDLRCLLEANIIGVTTTGLARQLDLLRNLPSKVLICEEAGEVLEAHILTALLPSLEHAILIGDHLQLPPHIQNYELSRENPRGEQYSLDVSLFERLAVPTNMQEALPLSVLETQRRMHPSISSLIRKTLYPPLKDSPHVEDYPAVAGMKKRLFWFDHRQPEAGSDSTRIATTSHSNDFEIDMVVALVTHLVRQGVYKENEIAILTPYLGQLHKIRKMLRNQFEITMNERDVEEMARQGIEDDDAQRTAKGVVQKTALLKALAVSTIDNFQGEEAKVVLVSLVRSNDQNKCGFLRTPNRINVLLSRAKHGMYIIGNSKTSSHVKMWADVIDMLEQEGNIGSQLELECPRHPETSILVSTPDDFTVFSPEGGCDRKCDKRLDCGHRDQSKCHSEALHKAVKCLEPCPRALKGCEHGCPRLCGEECVHQCQVQLTRLSVELECGHVKTALPCWQYQNPSTIQCQSVVIKATPGCAHELNLSCCTDITSESFKCTTICGVQLECGHLCQKLCFQCTVRHNGVVVAQDHGSCQQVCGKKLNTCNHYCTMKCHGTSPCECTASCDHFCQHSRCGKRCSDPCIPCADTTCMFGSCTHGTKPCTMPCAAPCDWLPCSKRCDKILTCGHQCPTVCGEKCPSPQFCQICADEEVKNNVVDFIMMSTYQELNLDEDPCVIPACGHILSISSMDGQMEMSEHYTQDDNIITGIRTESLPFSMDKLKVCGTCRGPLRNIARYGRIVRRALLDESTKKFIRWAGLKTIALAGSLHEEQQKLTQLVQPVVKVDSDDTIMIKGTPLQQVDLIRKKGGPRYRKAIAIRNELSKHLNQVHTDEQPFKRVWDLVQHAKRSRDDVGDMYLDTSVLQTRETMQVTSLLIRCDLAILTDFFSVVQKAEIKVDLSQNRLTCIQLIQSALEADQPLHAVEGHIYYAQLCAVERSHTDVANIDPLIKDARDHIEAGKAICKQSPGSTRRVVGELEDVEKMLRNATFYMPMRDKEWNEVLEAMSQEFRGSGHWYTCENGHPFTIGECDMPMQLAKCPQCDAPIGGQHHATAAGVTHADDLEERFQAMRL